MRAPAAVALALAALVHGMVVVGRSLPKTPRFQHSAEIFNGQLCVFGGKSTSTGTQLSDFLTDYQCVDITKSVEQDSPAWKHQSSASRFAMPPLAQHTSVYDRYNHLIVPYGGQAPATFSQANQLAVYCTLYQAWGASNAVDADPRRYLHTAVLQARSSDMLIFGGASDNTTFNGNGTRYKGVSRMVLDIARHAENNRRVGRPTTAGLTIGTVIIDHGDMTPEPLVDLVQHSTAIINDTLMVVLGGNVYDSSTNSAVMREFDTVHVYDVDKLAWSSRNCTGDIPPARSVAAVAQRGEYIYLHGGVNVTGWEQVHSDLYELNTQTWAWRRLATPETPRPRYAHQIKALGHYLIVTNGFITNGSDAGVGDANIYFYDLRKQAYVNKYSPSGISKEELDTEWTVVRTRTTSWVSALCFVLTVAVALVATYYLAIELRKLLSRRARPRYRQPSTGGVIRSMVESYTETLRQSTHLADGKFGRSGEDRRASQDTEGGGGLAPGGGRRSFSVMRVMKSPDGRLSDANREQKHVASEGATTVVGSSESGSGPVQSQSSRGIRQNMRHARILDECPDNAPYVSRKLTLSAHLSTYRAPRPGGRPAPRQAVRFSDYSDGDDRSGDCISDANSDAAPNGIGGGPRATTTIDSANLELQDADPSRESADDGEEDAAVLRLVNADNSAH
ncbi:hypothetical protein LPJ61_004002 [Coemansia biformis]|uniref:Galactose oxidase n=1 Tax=Coemansia biformis TaxID=1286918 RepID=A0A9W7YAC3_9FUNG|nr:hypothetical protein LPJ61_004002 [Coemansia biformis]